MSHRCGSTDTDTADPCERRIADDRDREHCWEHAHSGESVSGAPSESLKGNQNAAGNSGGGAPGGNTNAMTHGLNMNVKRQYQSFDPTEREAFRFYVEYYHDERGLDDLVQAKRLAIAEVMADRVETDLAEGIYKEIEVGSGRTAEVPKESMFEAHAHYITTIRLKQHHEGLSRHPSSDRNVEQFVEGLSEADH